MFKNAPDRAIHWCESAALLLRGGLWRTLGGMNPSRAISAAPRY
jgi:hypothetical protein